MPEGFQIPGNGSTTAQAPPPATEPTPMQSAIPKAGPWPIVVKLKHPILGNNRESLSQLTFREPTAGDIINCGNPVRMLAAGEVVIEERKMSFMMAQLSGVLLPLLGQMSPQDWNTCAYKLMSFFLPDWDSL